MASKKQTHNQAESIPLTDVITDQQKKKPPGHTFDEALKEAGFGWAQVWITLVCGFSLMASANESMGMGIILPAAQCDLDLDMSRKGIISGAVFLGIMISTYYWGYQTDIRGRKAVLKITLLSTVTCSLASSFVNSFQLMVVLRLLVGLFVSATTSSAVVYLGEFCPANRRGQMICYACAIGGLGMAYVAAFSWWILSYEWRIVITESFAIRPWRLLLLVNTVPGLIAGITFCFYPETPKFLLARNKPEEALEVLRWVHKQNKGKRFNVQQLQVETNRQMPSNEGVERKQGILQTLWRQISPMMKLPNSAYLIASCVQTATAYITYGGLGVWFPQLMNIVFQSELTTGTKICSILQTKPTAVNKTELAVLFACNDTLPPEVFIYTLIMGIMCGGYMLLSSAILAKLNEKTMIYINLITAGCAGILLQYITHVYVVAALFCVQIVAASLCVVLVRSIQVTVFPMQVKATAISLTNLAGRAGMIVSNVMTGILIVQQCTITLYVIATLLFISAGLNALFP